MPSGVYERTAKSRNRFNELKGKKFGMLTVLSEIEGRKSDGLIRWNCVCDCGKNHISTGNCLRTGRTKSCGCLLKKAYNKNPNRKEQLISYLYRNGRINYRKGLRGDKGDLTIEDFTSLIEKPCHYCGLEKSNYLKDVRGGKKISDFILYYNGLDRLDSSGAYTKDNVVPCCKHCNRAKMELTEEFFLNHIERIYNYRIK